MPTWFLPPDFTFTSEGPIKLGTVLEHPSRPTLVLASLPSDTGIVLPEESIIMESNHSHERSTSRSGSLNVWTKFLEMASASVSTTAGHSFVESYSAVDHEIHSFTGPLTVSTAAAITALHDVKKYIDSGLFGKKSVYIVTGLRIAKDSFKVMKEVASNFSGEVSGSALPTGGTAPIEAGSDLSGSSERRVTDSYETAPGIVFAYRLSIIRTKRAGVEVELFSDKGAFLTGDGTHAELPLVVVEATKEELEEDLEEQISFEASIVGEYEYCISF
ncbi:uncharacterized protein BHQ10_000690 [Talaromyces amestolkiae]|uniref:Uncharacterized protein n=1 Tax=Talaromyces amestolkiae TaxID=1196081 RepID=A0A364KM96_TALAM|nr:uncharacterized protein BHQ10_000690 [Talaromyces amestolkiae]RAO64678.1 hypothetical protein BHQ10_000690 [Talaromyces amestolkiae]